jgi:hypothetical protein
MKWFGCVARFEGPNIYIILENLSDGILTRVLGKRMWIGLNSGCTMAVIVLAVLLPQCWLCRFILVGMLFLNITFELRFRHGRAGVGAGAIEWRNESLKVACIFGSPVGKIVPLRLQCSGTFASDIFILPRDLREDWEDPRMCGEEIWWWIGNAIVRYLNTFSILVDDSPFFYIFQNLFSPFAYRTLYVPFT